MYAVRGVSRSINVSVGMMDVRIDVMDVRVGLMGVNSQVRPMRIVIWPRCQMLRRLLRERIVWHGSSRCSAIVPDTWRYQS